MPPLVPYFVSWLQL